MIQKTLSTLFTVNGLPMFAPDDDVAMSYEDIDASDSGRDEAGVMHRIVIRYKVGVWSFEYAYITEEEKNYLERLFLVDPDVEDPDEDGEDLAEFSFGHPGRFDATKQVVSTAYRSKYGIAWKNATKGLWRNYKFNIIQC